MAGRLGGHATVFQMQQHCNLMVTDILPKHAWAIGLQGKTGSEIAEAFTRIFIRER